MANTPSILTLAEPRFLKEMLDLGGSKGTSITHAHTSLTLHMHILRVSGCGRKSSLHDIHVQRGDWSFSGGSWANLSSLLLVAGGCWCSLSGTTRQPTASAAKHLWICPQVCCRCFGSEVDVSPKKSYRGDRGCGETPPESTFQKWWNEPFAMVQLEKLECWKVSLARGRYIAKKTWSRFYYWPGAVQVWRMRTGISSWYPPLMLMEPPGSDEPFRA